MALVESFVSGMGTILGVQAVPIQNITDITIVEMRIVQDQSAAERKGAIRLLVDGVVYDLFFTLSEETYDNRTLEGARKRRNPNAWAK